MFTHEDCEERIRLARVWRRENKNATYDDILPRLRENDAWCEKALEALFIAVQRDDILIAALDYARVRVAATQVASTLFSVQ